MTNVSILGLFICTAAFTSCGPDLTIRERELSDAYLNPLWDDELLAYWQIDDLPAYRVRLVQEYFLARWEFGEVASGETVDKRVEFQKKLMINWLEHELILREMMVEEFEVRSDSIGPYREPLQEVLPDSLLEERLSSGMLAIYRRWAREAQKNRIVP